MKKILFTICMRSGSKGIKNKHFKLLDKKPLFYHTLEYVKNIKKKNFVAVSSDSKKILNRSKKYNVDFLIHRPKNLSSSKSSKIPVIKHALEQTEKLTKTKFDYIADFDATSPLRKNNDFKNALKLFLKKKADLLITATKSRKNPYFNMVELKSGRIKLIKEGNYHRRQDAPKVFDMNASFYIWKRKYLLNTKKLISKKTVLYEMSEITAYDIDNVLDLRINKSLINRFKKNL